MDSTATSLTCRLADEIPDSSITLPKKRGRTTTAKFASPKRHLSARAAEAIIKGSPKPLRKAVSSHGSSESNICRFSGTCVGHARVSSSNYRATCVNEAPAVIAPDERDDVDEMDCSVDSEFFFMAKGGNHATNPRISIGGKVFLHADEGWVVSPA